MLISHYPIKYLFIHWINKILPQYTIILSHSYSQALLFFFNISQSQIVFSLKATNQITFLLHGNFWHMAPQKSQWKLFLYTKIWGFENFSFILFSLKNHFIHFNMLLFYKNSVKDLYLKTYIWKCLNEVLFWLCSCVTCFFLCMIKPQKINS